MMEITMRTDDENFAKLAEWVQLHRLPMQLTAAELEQHLGLTAEAVLDNIDEIAFWLKKRTGLGMQVVLCPATPIYPESAYITVYPAGQRRPSVRVPETSPYPRETQP